MYQLASMLQFEDGLYAFYALAVAFLVSDGLSV
jgi:hypothetical protein